MSQTGNIKLFYSIILGFFLGANGIEDDGVAYNNCLTWGDNDATLTLTCRIPRMSTFVKFYHEKSKTAESCNLTENTISCHSRDTNFRFFYQNDNLIAVFQKQKLKEDLNGVWYCQAGKNRIRLRTDVDFNNGITGDTWVKIKTSVIKRNQRNQKILIECSSCRQPFRNYTEIWINGQTSTSVWLNPSGHCIHGRNTPCNPYDCSCSPSGNKFEIAYDNLEAGTEVACSMYFEDLYRNERIHVSAKTTFNGSVLSSCSDSSATLTATDDISTLTSPGYRTGSYNNKNTTLTTSPGLADKGTNKDFVTTGQYAFVVFTTDLIRQTLGFTMQYLRAKDLSGTGCSAEQSLKAISTDQFLTSPSFPTAYPGNANCRWLIKAPEGTVKFELLFSDIQTSPNCGSDYLKIYDSTYAGEQLPILTACTRYPGITINHTSNGTSVLVLFVSDAVIGYRGFKMKFSSVATPKITMATEESPSVYFFDFFLDKTYIPLWISIALFLVCLVSCMICVGKKCRSCQTSKIVITMGESTDQETHRNVQNSEDQLSDYEYIDENQMLSQADLQPQLSDKRRPSNNASYFSIISSSPLTSSGSANSHGYLDVIADPYESPVTSRYLNCDEEHKYCTTINRNDVHVYQNDAFVQ